MRHLVLLVLVIFLRASKNSAAFAFASVDINKDVNGNSSGSGSTSKAAWDAHEECPICMRVLAFAKETAKRQSILPSVALGKFCDLESKGMEAADEKFCYDVMTMSATLYRQLDLKGTAERCCKRVYQTNPDFCRRKDTDAGRRQADQLAEEEALNRIKEQEEEAAAEAVKIAAFAAEKEERLAAKAAEPAVDVAPAAGGAGSADASGERMEAGVSATGDLTDIKRMSEDGTRGGLAGAGSGSERADGVAEAAATGVAQDTQRSKKTTKTKKKKKKTMGVIYE